MKFIIQEYWTGSTRPYKSYRGEPVLEYSKFNHAVNALRLLNMHGRLIIEQNDGTLKTIMLHEIPDQGKYFSQPFTEETVAAFLKLNNGLYIHKKLIRKTSIRRKT